MSSSKLYSTILTFCFLSLIGSLLPAQSTSIIKGTVTNACGEPLFGVPVHFNGPNSGQVTTDENGMYIIEVDSGGIYDVQPFVVDHIQNGVDTNDLAALQEYFLFPDAPLTPYQIIAADVNRSGGISTFDLVIISKIAMGIPVSISEPYWIFIDEAYVFPDPTNPWIENIPAVFSVLASEDTLCLNFVGIKAGDVDCSADTNLNQLNQTSITGKVYKDINEDCALGMDDYGLEGLTLRFDNGEALVYATTDLEGNYFVSLEPGIFTVSIVLPNGLWEVCENNIVVSLEELEQEEQNFGLQPIIDEPFMEVDISASFLRRCTTNTYSVHYRNGGPALTENAAVKVQFDDWITPVSSTIPWVTDAEEPNTYYFEIGNVASLQSGGFDIVVDLSCEATFGQTHCVNAQIFPEPDLPAGPDWDGSSLELDGSCQTDSVKFYIENVGENMEAPIQYIVIEDDLIMISGEMQLLAGESRALSFAADGTTRRVELEQSPGHPGLSFPSLSLEGCGTNENGTYSLGYVTQFPEDDANAFISINCQENIGPFDPNDKRAFPKGVGENHSIDANTVLDYQIRFQNVGTDTAFNVVIKDTLPTKLDPASLQVGSSSHPCQFELGGEGVLTVIFEDIHLPDSTTNDAASQGFVHFKIGQKPNHPAGTIIENKAAIYFDFNEPVITNYSWHTIGERFAVADSVSISGEVSTIAGNPLDSVKVTLQPLGWVEWTNPDGYYQFDDIPTMGDYQIVPEYEGHPLSGLTTFDLVLIHRHILDIMPFTSPYQYLAADMNNSGGITALDIVVGRRLILGIMDDFPNLGTWLFLPTDFTFPDPNNPWTTPVPTIYSIENLLHPIQADFIGIKKGDVNGSAGN